MKLTAKRDAAGNVAYVNGEFDWVLGSDPALKREATVSAGYADISGPRAWALFGPILALSQAEIRDEMLAFVGSWATLSTDDRKAMVEMFAYPVSATQSELDFLYSAADRDAFRNQIADAIVLQKNRQAIIASMTSEMTNENTKVFSLPGSSEQQLGQQELASAGDVISIANLPAKRYLRIMAYLIPSGGDIDAAIRFNNDSGTNYSDRFNENAAEGQVSSANGIRLQPGTYNERYFVNVEIMNIAARAKMVVGFVLREGGSGSGVIPTRALISARWENTTALINRIDIVQRASARDFAIGSNMMVRGWD